MFFVKAILLLCLFLQLGWDFDMRRCSLERRAYFRKFVLSEKEGISTDPKEIFGAFGFSPVSYFKKTKKFHVKHLLFFWTCMWGREEEKKAKL